MKKLLFILVSLFAISLTSCGVQSDDTTESMLRGKWIGAYDDPSDGIHVEIKYKFKYVNSKLTLRTFTQTTDLFDLESGTYLYTVKWNGSWKASKDKIQFDISPESVTYEYSEDIDPVEFGRFTTEFEEEIKNDPTWISDIKSISWSSWTEVDDEGTTIVYDRIKRNE